MKTLFISLIISLLLTLNSQAQTTFQNVYGGTAMDECQSVKQTPDGGYILAGTTTSYGAGGRDVLVIKTSDMGDTIWTKTFGGATDNEYGFSAEVTADGGYIVSGIAASFSDVAGDFYLIRLTSDGDTLWTKTYGGIGYETGTSVQQTAEGGFIVCGQTPAFGAGGFDAYLIKINEQGEITWTKTYGGSGQELGISVQQTSDEGYILCGLMDTFGAGADDFYLVKTDAQGNVAWTKAYGESGTESIATVKQTSDGGYIIGGTTENTLGPLGPNMCLIKTNSTGDTLWSKLYGGNFIDECYDVIQTSDGGYAMCGKSFSFSTAGDYDVYVVKVNGEGATQWSKTYGESGGGAANDIGYSIEQTTDGGYIIAGETVLGEGIKNAYLIKTDANGLSGCNEGEAATITTNFFPQVTTPTTQVSSGGSMTQPATMVNSGTIQNNLCATSVYDLESKEEIYLFPNPCQQYASIMLPNGCKTTSIKIYNLIGKLVYSSTFQYTQLDLTQLQSGVYVCEIQTINYSSSIKLVKQ
jgi:Secretion system C-terminal sorting domain